MNLNYHSFYFQKTTLSSSFYSLRNITCHLVIREEKYLEKESMQLSSLVQSSKQMQGVTKKVYDNNFSFVTTNASFLGLQENRNN